MLRVHRATPVGESSWRADWTCWPEKTPSRSWTSCRGSPCPSATPTTQYFVTGFDGFPAFGFKAGASIKHPYRLFLPERLYRQFSILVAVKPDTAEPMFLFAVVNPLENLIQLGVSLTPGNSGSANVSLYYTDGERHMTSQTIASFLVPQFTGVWTRFAFKVTEDEIHLWFNCQLSNMLLVKRVPLQLVFDSASTLYIGQAGGIFKGEFERRGRILKIIGSAATTFINVVENSLATVGVALVRPCGY
nr:collagen alpha-1(XV) chain-like [Penaeus vannamei]